MNSDNYNNIICNTNFGSFYSKSFKPVITTGSCNKVSKLKKNM